MLPVVFVVTHDPLLVEGPIHALQKFQPDDTIIGRLVSQQFPGADRGRFLEEGLDTFGIENFVDTTDC